MLGIMENMDTVRLGHVCVSLRRSKFSVIMAISRHRIVGYHIMDHNCRCRKQDFVKFIQDLNLSALEVPW